jgi:hypothetical protein
MRATYLSDAIGNRAFDGFCVASCSAAADPPLILRIHPIRRAGGCMLCASLLRKPLRFGPDFCRRPCHDLRRGAPIYGELRLSLDGHGFLLSSAASGLPGSSRRIVGTRRWA